VGFEWLVHGNLLDSYEDSIIGGTGDKSSALNLDYVSRPQSFPNASHNDSVEQE
jgi:hypothetical protein